MGAAIIGVLNWVDPVIGEIDPESPAALAGFRSGDRIRSADGIPLPHTAALNHVLGNLPDSQTTLIVENSGESREIVLKKNGAGDFTGVFRREPGPSSRTDVFRVESGRSAKLGIFGSFSRGIEETYLAWSSTWKGLGMLFRGADIGTSVSGPFRLISETGSVVVKGFSHGFGPGMLWSFEIMALISVSLALLNLLPIPVLDGGQTLLFLTEIIRGKPTNPRSVYRYQIVGTIIVLIIFVGATMNDFLHIRNR
jgi:regulator of sigma E protease